MADVTWSLEHSRLFHTPAIFMPGMVTGRLGLFVIDDPEIVRNLTKKICG
jgi:hypothetical protein